MKIIKTLLVVVIFFSLLLGGLFISRPSEKDFCNWIDSEIAKKTEDKSLGGKLKGLIQSTQAQLMVDYNDCLFYAVVQSRIGSEKHRYLGIAGIWLEI